MLKNKKIIIVISVIVLVAAGALAAWYMVTRPETGSREPVYNNYGDSGVPAEPNGDEAAPPNPKANPPDPNASTQASDEVPVSQAASLTISQLEQVGGEVKLNSRLSGAGQGGTCVASFTHPDGRPVVREFTSNGQGGCGPVSIPAIEFSVLGEWQLTLRFYNQGQQVIAKRSIVVN